MNLKELRLRKMLTQKALADAMKTTQQTVARWETGKTMLNAEQIKDLCLVLNCTAKQLLGEMRDQSDDRHAPHLFPIPGAPYGTLKLSLTAGVKEYPIDNETREDLLVQLSEMDSERADQSDALWLAVWTLDNRYLIINPRHLRKVNLVSETVEELSPFESDDVYRALADWPTDGIKRKTKDACEALIEKHGLQAAQSLALELCVTFDDGLEHRADLTENSAPDLWELTNVGQTGERVCFVELNDEGFEETTFINVARIALLELPASRFRQLMG